MYKFDNISNLNEMKELCFYIKVINEAKEENKFNKSDLMPLKKFIENRYNLEISLSKLYLFVEKITYLSGNKNKIPNTSDIDKIIKEYIKYHKSILKEAEIEILTQELNLKDAKYKTKNGEYKSAEELSSNIAVNKKIFTSNNNWLLLISGVTALFIVALCYVCVGCFVPNLLTIFISKPQEIWIAVLLLLLLFTATYLISLETYAKSTKKLRIKIVGYDKYSTKIAVDFYRYNQAKLAYQTKLKDFSINGIEFSESLIYNYLKENDGIDVLSYSNKPRKGFKTSKYNGGIGSKKIGVVLSKQEQDYNWLKSEAVAVQKKNINKEVVSEVNNLASKLQSLNLSTATLAKDISDFYCIELSTKKRKANIDNAQTKIELETNYLKLMDKITEFKNLSVFQGTDVRAIKKYNMLEDAEKLSFKDFLGVMCDRIEKAGELKLLEVGEYETYNRIKEELTSGVIYGINIDAISTRYELSKLFVKIYNDLASLDSLN